MFRSAPRATASVRPTFVPSAPSRPADAPPLRRAGVDDCPPARRRTDNPPLPALPSSTSSYFRPMKSSYSKIVQFIMFEQLAYILEISFSFADTSGVTRPAMVALEAQSCLPMLRNKTSHRQKIKTKTMREDLNANAVISTGWIESPKMTIRREL